MHGLCPHEFFWPRRAADGHYYQVCFLCGAEYEYDWKSMRRLERKCGELETTPASGLLSSNLGAHLKAAPRLTLLLELEPAHRVFFRNLADLLLFRSTSPIATASRPAPFWGDVFVNSGVPWWWLLESMLCHMMAVAVMVILPQGWSQREQPQPRRTFHKSYVLSYYTPSQSFPALGSSRSRIRARSDGQPESAPQAMIRVAPEHTPRIISPPAIKLAELARPNIVASNPAPPAMPLFTGRLQLTIPTSPLLVVAPPPDLNHATAARPGLPQPSVVAPPPDVEAVSSRRAIIAPNATVVAPPPTVEGAIRKVGDTNIGQSEVVEPAPRLPMYQQRAVSGVAQATLGGPATLVVPPPPSVPRSGTLIHGRASSLPSASLQVVPPAPSVQNPGNSAGGGRPMTMDIHPAVASPPVIDNPRGPATEELPVRLIGLALAFPRSSYFSNYEVFIAERAINKVESQLIKLVYVFLPYQRPLSEYGLNNSRVYKLRVRRDRTCDETLLQMTWPETDPHPGSQYSTDSPALSPNYRNSVVPCYRTTADDYKRALSRGR